MAPRGAELMPGRGRARAGTLGLVVAAVAAVVVCVAMTWGPGASRTLLESAAPTQKLADSFDADSLYSDKKIIDGDHPNRIDGYGCLFSDCDAQGGGGLMTKGENLHLLHLAL